MDEREPIVKGGQGRSDAEVEQWGFVGLGCLLSAACVLFALLLGWLAAGGMG